MVKKQTMNKQQQQDNIKQVRVDLQERSYDIIVGKHILRHIGKRIAHILPGAMQVIVTDEHVAKHHLATVEASLKQQNITYHTIILPPGEKTKSFEQLHLLLNQLLALRPERKTGLIALGGGVIGDLTGFAASILLRGVTFIQVPTTLLAQVDSSVGGKTGINTEYGKNLVGSFYQPKLVMADMAALHTLPEREYKAGYAEVVKYGVINDKKFFQWLVTQEEAINTKDTEFLRHAVVTSCTAKATIVAQDEREAGSRALLNLGHTFGHALEVAMEYDGRLLHGEAVAIGMVMACIMSEQMGLCKTSEAKEALISHLKSVGLPTSPYDIAPEWDIEQLVQAMYQDKKVSDGKLVFILLKDIGESMIVKGVTEKQVRECLRESLAKG